MKRILFLLAVSTLAVVAQAPTAGTISKRGPAVIKALEASRESNLKINKHGEVDSRQVDNVFARLFGQYRDALAERKIAQAQAEQGGTATDSGAADEMYGLQIRYSEMFPTLPDDASFPATEMVMNDGPESTFVGLTLYGRNRLVIGRVTSKVKVWRPSSTSTTGRVFPSRYENKLLATNGDVLTNPMFVLYFSWADIKNKIAFDQTAKKLEEDRQLETDALARH